MVAPNPWGIYAVCFNAPLAENWLWLHRDALRIVTKETPMPDVYTSSYRHYREHYRPRGGDVGFQVVVEHTDLWVVATRDFSDEVLTTVHELRGQLKAYITLHPEFGLSLAPVEVEPNAPELILEMAHAAALCNVGPMAAVAGAIAQAVAERFVERSPDFIVENGGDTFLCSTRDRVVGLLPDPAHEAVLGIKLAAEDFPVSLCASSATIGHSLSLGQGELLVVRSPNASFADAAATALLNLLKHKRDLDKVLQRAQEFAVVPQGARSDHYLEGVFAQLQGRLGVWGKMELAML